MSCYVLPNTEIPSVLAANLEQKYGEVVRDRVMAYVYSDQFKEKYKDIEQEPTLSWLEENIEGMFPEVPDLLPTSIALDTNQVNYKLKAVNILQSDKAKEVFEKGRKNLWSLDKILTELQLPKEQKTLVLAKNIADREEIITSLLADNSYVIEVNVAKERLDGNDSYEAYEKDGEYFIPNFEGGKAIKISKEEYNNIIINIISKNTSYYSGLTVPGGTNGSYREQNFETSLIKVPKSHAQFNTENTIGFSRNDDRQIYTEKDVNSLLEVMQKSGILEIKC